METPFSNQIAPWAARVERLSALWFENALKPLGLTYAEFRLVGALWGEREGLAQKDLARKLNVDASGISVALKRLETNGIVERVRAREDARIVRVRCSPRARRLPEVLALTEKLETLATAGLSDAERQVAIKCLRAIADNLEGALARGFVGQASPTRLTTRKSQKGA